MDVNTSIGYNLHDIEIENMRVKSCFLFLLSYAKPLKEKAININNNYFYIIIICCQTKK